MCVVYPTAKVGIYATLVYVACVVAFVLSAAARLVRAKRCSYNNIQLR